MGYLEDKRKALMMNVIGGGQTTTTVEITNGSGSLTYNITIDEVTETLTIGANQFYIKGNIGICYINPNVYIYSLGNLTINGESFGIFDSVSFHYSAQIDYTVVGNVGADHNKVEVKTMNVGGNYGVLIVDENQAIRLGVSDMAYDEAIKVVYSSGWKMDANQSVEVDGVTYQATQRIASWKYNESKRYEVLIL